jgi:hypothetical protein
MLAIFTQQFIFFPKQFLLCFQEAFLRGNDLALLEHLLPSDLRLVCLFCSRPLNKVNDEQHNSEVKRYATE